MIVGVDPGLSGCLVAINGNEYVSHLHMPVLAVGKHRAVDGAAIAQWLEEEKLLSARARVELVSAMPKQGVSSTFRFGHSAGTVAGVLQAVGLAIDYVTPGKWKKFHGITGMGKDAARSRAILMFPHIKDLRLKGKGQALGDAILIALSGDS